jgi:hypothetical protein
MTDSTRSKFGLDQIEHRSELRKHQHSPAFVRGKYVPSAPWYHHLFGGERRNDHHTTLAGKRAARAQAAE